MRNLVAFVILFVVPAGTSGQAVYPKKYFRNPLIVPMELTANFGELRSNHWHMGLDIRTKQKENLPVLAAAGGYISFVGIRAESFGRFIIINHPNGLSTLYAHLNDFYPELEEYVTAEQYKQERWAIELPVPPNKFRVSKGQLIAYSGNTGGSQGPHLHFEIRDTKTGRSLNPLLFEFPLADNVPPSLLKLAVYDREHSVFNQAPVLYSLKKTDTGYIIPRIPVLRTGTRKLSFAIQAYDRLSGSSNPNGIYSAGIYLGDELVFGFEIDSMNYDETRYLNAHIDYRLRAKGGSYYQHISRLPGDHGVIYRLGKGDGVITLDDTSIHAVTIVVKDAYRNASTLNFLIRYDDSMGKKPAIQAERVFIPGQVNILEEPGFEVYLPERSLYDTVAVSYKQVNSLHVLNDATIPLHGDMTVRIRNSDLPAHLKVKTLIRRSSGGSTSTKKATWQDDWALAKFDEFGSFQLIADTIPPTVNEPGTKDTIDLSKVSRIIFKPADNLGIIREFRAELDGKWLRFTNDKGRYYIYKFDDRWTYGIHNLEIYIEDLAGNQLTKNWWIKRHPYTPPKKKPASKKRRTRKK